MKSEQRVYVDVYAQGRRVWRCTAMTVLVAAVLSIGSNANNARELSEQFLRRGSELD
jgi:hypothetical protein